MGFKKMAAMCCAVLLTDHGMRMDCGLIVLEGNITDERQQLELFVQRDGGVIFLVAPVKPAQLNGRKSANRLKLAAATFCCIENSFKPSASSSPVSKISA